MASYFTKVWIFLIERIRKSDDPKYDIQLWNYYCFTVIPNQIKLFEMSKNSIIRFTQSKISRIFYSQKPPLCCPSKPPKAKRLQFGQNKS